MNLFNINSFADLWSAGVVLSELILGEPLFFHSTSSEEHLKEVIRKLGVPTREDFYTMNFFALITLPVSGENPLAKYFPPDTPKECLDLLRHLLLYNPFRRILPLHACAHPFFDELRMPGKRWFNGNELPPLFNFTSEETNNIFSQQLVDKLIPRDFFLNLYSQLIQ